MQCITKPYSPSSLLFFLSFSHKALQLSVGSSQKCLLYNFKKISCAIHAKCAHWNHTNYSFTQLCIRRRHWKVGQKFINNITGFLWVCFQERKYCQTWKKQGISEKIWNVKWVQHFLEQLLKVYCTAHAMIRHKNSGWLPLHTLTRSCQK